MWFLRRLHISAGRTRTLSGRPSPPPVTRREEHQASPGLRQFNFRHRCPVWLTRISLRNLTRRRTGEYDMTTYVFDHRWQRERQRLEGLEEVFDASSRRYLLERGVGSGWRCLEVGCGAGGIARWLADHHGSPEHSALAQEPANAALPDGDGMPARQWHSACQIARLCSSRALPRRAGRPAPSRPVCRCSPRAGRPAEPGSGRALVAAPATRPVADPGSDECEPSSERSIGDDMLAAPGHSVYRCARAGRMPIAPATPGQTISSAGEASRRLAGVNGVSVRLLPLERSCRTARRLPG